MARTATTARAAATLSASNGERAGVRCRNDAPPKDYARTALEQHTFSKRLNP